MNTARVYREERVVRRAPVVSREASPYIALSGIGHLLFLIVALTMPEGADAMEIDAFAAQDQFLHMVVVPEREETREFPKLGSRASREEASHEGEQGEAGREHVPSREEGRMAIQGDEQDRVIRRERDERVAQSAGVLGVLRDQVSNPFGTVDESVGTDAVSALGSIAGEGVGETHGTGGLSLSSTGRGGGGHEKSLGAAQFATKGRAGVRGSTYGRDEGDVGEHSERVPEVVAGKPIVCGGESTCALDREIIRRVVRQHRNEIRFCYEKQLQTHRDLAGTVKIKFTISGTGSVVSALVGHSTLENREVEGCMQGKIRRWVFPAPRGGGMVVVNYPFHFRS